MDEAHADVVAERDGILQSVGVVCNSFRRRFRIRPCCFLLILFLFD